MSSVAYFDSDLPPGQTLLLKCRCADDHVALLIFFGGASVNENFGTIPINWFKSVFKITGCANCFENSLQLLPITGFSD